MVPNCKGTRIITSISSEAVRKIRKLKKERDHKVTFMPFVASRTDKIFSKFMLIDKRNLHRINRPLS